MNAAARPYPDVEPDEARPPSYFVGQWAQADKQVPFPFLYYWLARPTDGPTAESLLQLRRMDFVYNVGNNFIAHVASIDGRFSRAVLSPASFGFKLLPIPERHDLLTPEAAERCLERDLLNHRIKRWAEFFLETGLGLTELIALEEDLILKRYQQIPWHSLQLERPLRAGVIEPVYKFRKANSRCEFWVGARSGEVRHEHVVEPSPSLTLNPIDQ